VGRHQKGLLERRHATNHANVEAGGAGEQLKLRPSIDRPPPATNNQVKAPSSSSESEAPPMVWSVAGRTLAVYPSDCWPLW
jgi:hypothetical protein